MIKNYFKKDDNYILFTGEELKIYVPFSYLESNLADSKGEKVESFGLLKCSCKAGGKTYNSVLNIPTFNTFYPTNRDVEVIDEEKHLVMIFGNGDKVMNLYTQLDSDNGQLYVYLICRGKIPKEIPYSQLLKVWDKNMEMNGVNFKVASTIKEIIIAELCRTKGKPQEKYAVIKGKNPKADEWGYEPTNINKVCAMSSTFSAMTFENMDQMIISSINMKRYGKKEKETPLEKIIKM